VLLLEINNGNIELIDIRPFETNYRRWQPFDINNTIPIYFHLYADGFRTWMSRSGHVVGIYMSLSQLPIDQLNYAENIKLVALVPVGIKTMDVFRVISEDISQMQRRPIPLWNNGRKLLVQPVLAFLKGDTPQRAIFTSTCGPSGFHFCHGCNANTEKFCDRVVLAENREMFCHGY